jgi:RNA polymerase sigma factor (sigma-70 family)
VEAARAPRRPLAGRRGSGTLDAAPGLVLTFGVANTPDDELVGRCRAGESAAWNELVERFSRYVLAIATRGYGLDQGHAEDVFQEVFTRVWERLDTLRSDDAFQPWLAQLTRRCCVDHIRARSREVLVEDPPDEVVDDVLSELDDALVVREALTKLGPECAEVLDRFFARDESYRAIAEALDLPQGTIASRISRCLAKLRLELDGRNTPPPPSREQVTR